MIDLATGILAAALFYGVCDVIYCLLFDLNAVSSPFLFHLSSVPLSRFMSLCLPCLYSSPEYFTFSLFLFLCVCVKLSSIEGRIEPRGASATPPVVNGFRVFVFSVRMERTFHFRIG